MFAFSARLQGKHRRKAVALAIGATALLAGGAIASAAQTVSPLVVSLSANRSAPTALNGASLNGNAYVFVNRAKVAKVAFALDGKPYSLEVLTPYDLATTAPDGSARALDTTKLTKGPHTVVAVVSTTTNRTRTYRANFTVGSPVASTTTSSTVTSSTVKPTTTSTTAGPTTTTIKPTTTTAIPATTTTTALPTTGSGAPPFAAAAGKTWNLSFAEEFNGTDYDHTKLTPCFDWNYGACTGTFNHGLENYKPSQVQVGGGIAKLVAEPMSPAEPSNGCFGGSCTYKSGLLSTARPNAADGSDYLYKYTYGYTEARLKVPSKQGFFTAFWMLPAHTDYNYNYEIDILEMLGNDPKTAFMTYHYNDRGSSMALNSGTLNNGKCAVIDYSKDFHNYAVDWEPNRVAFYIDGVNCGEFTNAAQIPNEPMQIILNMMVSNDWQRNWNVGLTDQTQKSEVDVDYIRVYQQH